MSVIPVFTPLVLYVVLVIKDKIGVHYNTHIDHSFDGGIGGGINANWAKHLSQIWQPLGVGNGKGGLCAKYCKSCKNRICKRLFLCEFDRVVKVRRQVLSIHRIAQSGVVRVTKM
jgi:hypothetical protein